LDFVTELLLRK